MTQWAPVPASERFAESISLVGLVHTPVITGQRALCIGPSAHPLLEAAARYPTFTELAALGTRSPLKDRRVTSYPRVADLPTDWKADVIAVAHMGNQDQVITDAAKLLSPNGVVVIACDRFQSAPTVKNLARQQWSTVSVFRDFLPEPSAFILASARPLTRTRPIPAWARHLSDAYLPNLFRLAKDEYAFLYQRGAA